MTLAVLPGLAQRALALRARRGYKLQSIVDDALSAHLDALEGLESGPIKAPARFKRALKRRKADEKSIFAPLINLA
jgi:hypothetical protein